MVSAVRCKVKISLSIGIDYRPNELKNIGISNIGKKSNITRPYSKDIPYITQDFYYCYSLMHNQ